MGKITTLIETSLQIFDLTFKLGVQLIRALQALITSCEPTSPTTATTSSPKFSHYHSPHHAPPPTHLPNHFTHLFPNHFTKQFPHRFTPHFTNHGRFDSIHTLQRNPDSSDSLGTGEICPVLRGSNKSDIFH